MKPHAVPVKREGPKERPIIFTGPLIRKILAGEKTQTRRVALGDRPCPQGKPGDRLWVRETWTTTDGTWDTVKPSIIPANAWGGLLYRADYFEERRSRPWRPPIFMPRWASRIQLEVVSVRKERLQKITEADALAEGCNSYFHARDEFKRLWQAINGKRHGGRYAWPRDPQVWAVEFKRI